MIKVGSTVTDLTVVDWTWSSKTSTAAILGTGTQTCHSIRRDPEACWSKYGEPTNPIFRVPISDAP